MSIRFIVFIIILPFIISACSSVDSLVDENSPTMEQIYQENANTPLSDSVQVHRQEQQQQADRSYNPYHPVDPHFLSAKTQTDNLFQKLPNPIIYMLVKPHPAGNSGAPIPGYITKFYMYERDHFAQPGELIDRDLNSEVR